MGYYNSGWKTYMNDDGQFFLGGFDGALKWDGSDLNIEGAVKATSGEFTGTITAQDGTIANFEISTNRLATTNDIFSINTNNDGSIIFQNSSGDDAIRISNTGTLTPITTYSTSALNLSTTGWGSTTETDTSSYDFIQISDSSTSMSSKSTSSLPKIRTSTIGEGVTGNFSVTVESRDNNNILVVLYQFSLSSHNMSHYVLVRLYEGTSVLLELK